MKKKATFKSLSELYKLHHPESTSNDFLSFALRMDFAMFIADPSRTEDENLLDWQRKRDNAELIILQTSFIIRNYKLKER